MKRCSNCRWYTLPVTAARCHTCKQLNPHKPQDNWEPLPSQVKGYTKQTGGYPPHTKMQDILDYIDQTMGMPKRVEKALKLQEEIEEESSINPMIVIEAKLK